jgi:cytochrome P450
MREPRALDMPQGPIAAVTHPDPYAYYASLVAQGGFRRDEVLGLWVASSAEAVTAVLAHPASRVRPADEPVPRALLGSPAAEIFRHLARMNDGAGHCPLKQALGASLDGIEPRQLTATAETCADRLTTDFGPGTHPAHLTELAFALPVYVVSSLLGVAEALQPELVSLVRNVVRCLFPGGTADEVERGKQDAGHLIEVFRAELSATQGVPGPSLLSSLAGHARRFGADDTVVIANSIGFMTQAYEATAALIATTLLTLARQPELLARIAESPDALGGIVEEALRFDSPVQNTRRFLAEPAHLGGQLLPAGESVLVVLAAANRDPRANPDPDSFDAARHAPQVFSFGIGPHACPGRSLATSIACSGVARLLARGVDPRRLDRQPGYRPSVNCRMPLLAWCAREA